MTKFKINSALRERICIMSLCKFLFNATVNLVNIVCKQCGKFIAEIEIRLLVRKIFGILIEKGADLLKDGLSICVSNSDL